MPLPIGSRGSNHELKSPRTVRLLRKLDLDGPVPNLGAERYEYLKDLNRPLADLHFHSRLQTILLIRAGV